MFCMCHAYCSNTTIHTYSVCHSVDRSIWIAGFLNPGVHNRGVRNPGVRNRGVRNPGVHNRGVHNPGVFNHGVHNPGVCNHGVHNHGVHNHVVCNHGVCNHGVCNHGVRNPGVLVLFSLFLEQSKFLEKSILHFVHVYILNTHIDSFHNSQSVNSLHKCHAIIIKLSCNSY